MIEEVGLIGSEAFGLGTIEPTQELVEPMLDAAQGAVLVVQGREQFADHPLERLGIVRESRVQRHSDGCHAQ